MWKYIEVTVVDGQRVLSCAAPLCTQYKGKSDNASRAKEHLLECAAARALHPDIRADVIGIPVRVGGTGAGGAGLHGSTGAEILPPLPPYVLNDWEQRFAMLIFGCGLPFSVFHSPEWRSMFLVISGGRFSGRGDPRTVGGARLDAASGEVMAHVEAAVRGADTAAVTVDGAGDVNGKSTYNVMVCLPKPLLLGSFRMGLTVSSAPNLLLSFRASLPASLLYP